MSSQSSPAVHVSGLKKYYEVSEREPGLAAAVRNLVNRKTRSIKAVDGVSFDVAQGEVVGFLGPNGAGKTTTLKMLAGLLYPTGGELSVLGYLPQKRESKFLEKITLVMGNRNQLIWDIPALDSFELNRAIYGLATAEFKKTRDDLISLLDLGKLVNKPVRNLSLGERMKAEFVGALLHQPKVLYLDEPTIGLDVTAQKRLREFIAEYNRRYGATVLLTSHYMADVEALCKRVVVIHHGQILYDGGLTGLVERFSAYKTIGLTLDNPDFDLTSYGEVMERDGAHVTLRVSKAETSKVTARLLNDLSVDDLTVEDPPIEDVIARVFALEKPQEVAA